MPQFVTFLTLESDVREIVEDGIQCDHVDVVFEFLGKSVGEPSKPPHVHPQRQVLALDVLTCFGSGSPL